MILLLVPWSIRLPHFNSRRPTKNAINAIATALEMYHSNSSGRKMIFNSGLMVFMSPLKMGRITTNEWHGKFLPFFGIIENSLYSENRISTIAGSENHKEVRSDGMETTGYVG